MKGAGGTDRLRFALVQLPGEHSAAESPGRVTLEYTPGDSERLPWLIRVDGEPVVRASDGDYVTSALVVVPQLISEGWTARAAVHRALEAHPAITPDQWEPGSPTAKTAHHADDSSHSGTGSVLSTLWTLSTNQWSVES